MGQFARVTNIDYCVCREELFRLAGITCPDVQSRCKGAYPDPHTPIDAAARARSRIDIRRAHANCPSTTLNHRYKRG